MAQRNQPYLKLYVQDFMSDEKLNECSAEATGVYIRLMCIMHKNEEYGVVRLKAKDKHSGRPVTDLARKLARQMPYDAKTIERGLDELLEEGVLNLDGDMLYQKRMVHDGRVSSVRAAASRQRWNRAFDDFAPPVADSFESDCGYANEDANGNANSCTGENPKPLQKCDYEHEYINNPESYSSEYTGLPNVGSITPRACAREDDGLASAFSLYFDKIDPSPSTTSMELLKGYVETLGADVVCHAINEAIDQGARSWSYIHGILKSYSAEGVRSIDDIRRREASFARRRKRTASVPQGGGNQLLEMIERGEFDDGS